MAITFVNAGTADQTATSNAAIAPGLPSGWAADDIHILVAHHSSNTDFNDPSGWTRITALTGNNTTAMRVVTWWRRAVAGDSAPSLTVGAVTTVRIARIFGFRGCVTAGNPWDAGAGAGPTKKDIASGTTVDTTSITTTVAGCAVLFLGTYEDDPTAASLPTNYTIMGTGGIVGTNLGTDAAIISFYRVLSGTGTEAPSTTVSGGSFSGPSIGMLIALKPPLTITPSGAMTPGGSLTKINSQNPVGSLTPAGALANRADKTLTGAATSAGVVAKLVDKVIAGVTGLAGALTAEGSGGGTLYMAVGLPKEYRFKVLNKTGQTITQDSGVTVKCKRVKLDSSGTLSYESSEATILDNSTTDISNNAYFAGTTQSNGTDKWLGGDFEFSVTAPTSASGDVILYFERSTDGGTDWDNDGEAQPVVVINFTTSGTKKRTFSL